MGLFINSSQQLISSSWFSARFFTNFGYKIDDPNPNDLLFSNSPLASAPMVENPDLRKYFKEISNQYQLSSCSANACIDSIESMIAKKDNVDPVHVPDLSRLFDYWNARNLETPPCADKDDGSRIRLCFDSVARYGVPTEAIYPYDVSKVNVRPTLLSYREAIKNRISAFYRISTTGATRIGQMKQALSAGNPIVFGTKVADSFRYVRDDSVIQVPLGGFIGAHAMVACGWDESKQAFCVRNSWGTDFGANGYCYMSKEYLMADFTRDLWVATI